MAMTPSFPAGIVYIDSEAPNALILLITQYLTLPTYKPTSRVVHKLLFWKTHDWKTHRKKPTSILKKYWLMIEMVE